MQATPFKDQNKSLEPPAAKLPKQLVLTVLGLTALPFVLNLCGLNFGTPIVDLQPDQFNASSPAALETAFYVSNRGAFVHTILEWTAFCIALMTVVMSFIHYNIKHDVTTPIIGTALFFSGTIDAFNTLAADHILLNVTNYNQFIPFTWAISRTFNVCIMIAGTGLLLWRGRGGRTRTSEWGMKLIIVVFGLVAYGIILACTLISHLPQSVYPGRVIPRPWDAIPLVLFLIAGGIIFPRFHRMYPSQFSHGLIVSVVPHTAAQIYAAFGSEALYDNYFNIAYYLKIIAYLVPLAGLLLDYTRAYHAEATLRASEEQFRIAREVQEGLFPHGTPAIVGYDICGVSYPAEATGGDYFDYFPMPDGRWGVVIADVSGHDLGASIVMAQTRAYLRAVTHTHAGLSEMITDLNRFLVEDLNDKRFVSMFFAQLDPRSGELNFTAAGHDAYVLHPTATVKKLSATGPLLGVDEQRTIPCGPKVTLGEGNIVVFLTDGIVEAESREGIPFGIQRALGVVSVNREKSAREIVDALTQAVRKHCRKVRQKDDVTIVVLKKEAVSRQPAAGSPKTRAAQELAIEVEG